MPLLFLDAINSTLKRVALVAGDSGELSTTTGTNDYTASTILTQRPDIQHSIDLLVEMWNEAAIEVYNANPNPSVVATATIILAADTRSYAMPNDFERVAGNTDTERMARCSTEQMWLPEYPGGYLKMIQDFSLATMWVGEPTYYAISNTDASFVVNFTPTASGLTYNLAYERTISLTATMATATMPFSDSVTRSLVPVVAEFYNRTKNKDFDREIFRDSLVRAMSFAHKTPPRRSWGARQISGWGNA